MIRDDIMAVKKQLEEVKEKSFAMELLSDFKKQNKRQFVIILIILMLWFLTIGYLVYVLNDIGVVEDNDSIDIEDVKSIDNSHIKIGDDVWEKSN